MPADVSYFMLSLEITNGRSEKTSLMPIVARRETTNMSKTDRRRRDDVEVRLIERVRTWPSRTPMSSSRCPWLTVSSVRRGEKQTMHSATMPSLKYPISCLLLCLLTLVSPPLPSMIAKQKSIRHRRRLLCFAASTYYLL